MVPAVFADQALPLGRRASGFSPEAHALINVLTEAELFAFLGDLGPVVHQIIRNPLVALGAHFDAHAALHGQNPELAAARDQIERLVAALVPSSQLEGILRR